jgi:hypothetical protein
MSSLLKRLDKHFAAAAVAGVAAVGASANAAIVWSGIVNINVPSTTSGVYLNVVTGQTGTSSSLSGWDLNPWSSTALNFFNSTTSGQTVRTDMVGSGTVANNLAQGTLISGASTFTNNTGTQTTTGLNLNSSNNLFGFKFWHEGAGAYRYGWVRISLGTSAGAQPRSIVEYAYEDTGAGLEAGVVPGPAGLAALALGAAGLRSRRRK